MNFNINFILFCVIVVHFVPGKFPKLEVVLGLLWFPRVADFAGFPVSQLQYVQCNAVLSGVPGVADQQPAVTEIAVRVADTQTGE